ncbi:McrB family protein [Armatimonas sp.]|uniref:McrB family protein n=1 Tax=Armatimonas sp. TaxID=1872638 RepID=UPI00374CC66C
MLPSFPLNTILYGPPGTGKTYETARRAVEIIDGKAPSDRTELMARYRQLQREGQIGFVTFHQSYAYEDFIEGIRPVMDEGDGEGTPRYRIVDGVFKDLTINALGAALESPPSDQNPHTSFATVWAMLEEQVIDHPQRTYKGLTDATEFRIEISATGSISGQNIKNPTMTSLLHTSRQRLETVWNAYASTDEKISSAQVQSIFTSNGHHFFTAALYNELKRIAKTLPPETPVLAPSLSQKAQAFLKRGDASQYTLQQNPPRYVLIVDEINRGNISKILGELITLLEDDKRIGEENELTVTLPYSREPFALPPNLYLIGTMNTADKSLALLDVALRRRFTFEELTPDFGVCGLTPEMEKVLEELNRRITLRKDRDHRIGHAFFMKVGSDVDAFNAAFSGKVLPLLQEYFFNDWDGVRYVLGEKDDAKGFVVGLDGGQDKGVRNRWQWYTDIGKKQEFSPLTQLQANYGNDTTA